MKFPVSLVHLVFLAFLIGCKSPIDHLNKNFKKVNEGLEKAGEEIIKSIDEDYNYIKSQRENHPDLVLLADSLYNASTRAAEYITHLQKMLDEADSTGSSLSNAKNLLGNGPHGDTLSNVLLHVYKSIVVCPVKKGKKFPIALIMRDIKLFGTDPNRKKTYFRLSTTLSAITLLTSFKSNVLTGTSWVMKDLVLEAKK